MAQFKAAGLARLLANVEREILVEALEIANLIHFLPARHLSILNDLEENWSTLHNVWLNGIIQEAATAEKALRKPRGLGQERYQQTGVMFVDAAVASVKLGLDYFNPNGIIAQLITSLDKLISDVAGIPTEPPEPVPDEEPPVPEIPQSTIDDINLAIKNCNDALTAAANIIEAMQKLRDDKKFELPINQVLATLNRANRIVDDIDNAKRDLANAKTLP